LFNEVFNPNNPPTEETIGDKISTLEEIITIQKLYIDTANVLIGQGTKNLHIIENND